MATLHIRPNRLRQDAVSRRRILFAGFIAAALTILIHPVSALLGFAVVIVFSRTRTPAEEAKRHGAEGEDLVLGIPEVAPGSLVTLPGSFTVFNQLIVPFDRGSCEIDFLVLGPNGIFVIEVKHHHGVITGEEHDGSWIQFKQSRMGHVYANPMRNPVAQVKRAIFGLKRYLVLHGVSTWIQGVVVLSHPDCVPDLGPMSVPVLRLPELSGYLLGARTAGLRRPDKPNEIIQALWEADLAPIRACPGRA